MYGILVLIALLTGCSTYAELGQGHVARTLVSEERSLFGTNIAYSKLQHCEKNKAGELVKCKGMTKWVAASSQGVGGQIISGAFIGAGIGAGAAFSGTSNAVSATSSSVSSAVSKGHHH